MADYYPLIARAIAGLDPSAPGESRRALYERARAALIAQLRSVEPPLSESEITRERLALEEAVRKVESEAAQRARDASRGADPTRSGSRAGNTLRANARPASPRPADAAQPASARQRPPSSPPRNDRPVNGADEPARAARSEAPRQPQVSMQDPPLPPARERPAGPRRAPDAPQPAAGVRGFRDITADVDDLGRAAAQANRAARKTYANVPSPSPEFDRLEPMMEEREGDPEALYSYDESVEEAERYTPPAPASQRPRIAADRGRETKESARSGAVFPFKSAIAVGIVLILVGAAILWGKSAVSTVSGLFKSSQTVVEAPKDSTAPATKPKIPD